LILWTTNHIHRVVFELLEAFSGFWSTPVCDHRTEDKFTQFAVGSHWHGSRLRQFVRSRLISPNRHRLSRYEFKGVRWRTYGYVLPSSHFANSAVLYPFRVRCQDSGISLALHCPFLSRSGSVFGVKSGQTFPVTGTTREKTARKFVCGENLERCNYPAYFLFASQYKRRGVFRTPARLSSALNPTQCPPLPSLRKCFRTSSWEAGKQCLRCL
jgi:hypothetical protein